jgi:hypothetical protein
MVIVSALLAAPRALVTHGRSPNVCGAVPTCGGVVIRYVIYVLYGACPVICGVLSVSKTNKLCSFPHTGHSHTPHSHTSDASHTAVSTHPYIVLDP